jgi:hypothetical protein
MWQWVRAGTIIVALPYLFLEMEWSEDRLAPSSFSSALPADAAMQDVIATKTRAAPNEIAGASPIVVPTAVSDCAVTALEPGATVGKAAKGKSVAKAKRTAKATTRASPTKIQKFIKVAVVGRGSKETRH